MMVRYPSIYDKNTIDWLLNHPGAETTVSKCSKCGLYYKPILGHKCKKENDHVQSVSLS